MLKTKKRLVEALTCRHCFNKAPMEIVAEYYHCHEHRNTERSRPMTAYQLLLCPVCESVTLRTRSYDEMQEPDAWPPLTILYPPASSQDRI
jgi:hypothetical protein